MMIVDTQGPPTVAKAVDVDRQGRLKKLLRLTAWVLRFFRNLRPGNTRTRGELSKEELIGAENKRIEAVQLDLKRRKDFARWKKVLALEKIGGVLRCVGRLGNSDLEVEAQRPIILPKDHIYTILTIEECHERVLHGGVRETLAELRSKFWVPKGRQCVKKVLNKCVNCKKLEGKAYSAPCSAAPPKFRVTEAPPFSKVGVDFAGPFYVKSQTASMTKVYIALFS